MKNVKSFFNPPAIVLLATAILIFINGCAHLQKGADPIIVRVEQSETIAESTFDLVVNVDNSDRGFWRTNAPAFHKFAEYLRAPVVLPSGTLPRGLAMIRQVDDAKLAYKSNVAQSNVLVIAVSSLENAINQAQAWSAIVKSPTP